METNISEVTPGSWDELMHVLFDETWRQDLRRHRSPYVFRGLTNSTYGLQPSLMRVGDHSTWRVGMELAHGCSASWASHQVT